MSSALSGTSIGTSMYSYTVITRSTVRAHNPDEARQLIYDRLTSPWPKGIVGMEIVRVTRLSTGPKTRKESRYASR